MRERESEREREIKRDRERGSRVCRGMKHEERRTGSSKIGAREENGHAVDTVDAEEVEREIVARVVCGEVHLA